MKNRFANDAGNPLQPGNALKNGNFDKAVFRVIGICLVITVLLGAAAYLFFAG